MHESTDAQIARLDERDTALAQRLGRIENKIDKLTDQMGDQKVTVAKWSGTISLLVSVAGALLIQAVM